MSERITVQVNRRYVPKYTRTTFQPGKTPSETIVTIAGTRAPTQKEFVTGFLRQRGKDGAFVNEMYNVWNMLRASLNKPRSTYPSFRKLIWNMKKENIIVPIPEVEIRARGLLGEAPIARSYYRLNPGYVEDE
jgi:hypothetical protein